VPWIAPLGVLTVTRSYVVDQPNILSVSVTLNAVELVGVNTYSTLSVIDSTTPDDDGNTSGGDDGDDGDGIYVSKETGIIIGACLGGVLLLVTIMGCYLWRRSKASSDDFARLNNDPLLENQHN